MGIEIPVRFEKKILYKFKKFSVKIIIFFIGKFNFISVKILVSYRKYDSYYDRIFYLYIIKYVSFFLGNSYFSPQDFN